MLKHVRMLIIVLLMILCVSGCSSKEPTESQTTMSPEEEKEDEYPKEVKNSNAAELKSQGVWEERYKKDKVNGTLEEGVITMLSINVNKDMTEDEMLQVTDYYRMITDDKYKINDSYKGKFTCYAVFYKGDTDEELGRIKYVDGEKAEITDADKYNFAPAYMINEDDEESGDESEDE